MTFADPGTAGDLVASVRHGFRQAFGRDCSVVARAPGRVNLIGEHTDYNAGPCLPLALPHATFAGAAARADGRVRLTSAQAADAWEGDLADVTPGTVPGWAGYVVGVLRAMQEAGHPVPGVEIHLDGRVPLGAGLSSSAALECSVAVAVCGLLGVDLSPDVRRELVAICIRAESEFVGAPTGGMDQTVSLLADEGSALLVDFADHTTSHVPLPLAERGLALLVTDTTVSHALAAEGGGGYGRRRRECAEAARRLGVETLRHADPARVEELSEDRLRRRARHVVTEIERVRRVVDATRAGDWQDVGVLLRESHRSMRDDFEISTPELDLAVASAMSAGALGARMTGGGFGGSSVALVEADRVPEIAAAISVDFARAGHAPPVHLVAAPSAGADLTAG